MKNFNNKIVVITGAGSGIGRALALEFASQGAQLALNDFDASALQETLELLDQDKTTTYVEAFDVGDRAAMFQFASNVEASLGAAHVIINNAGIEGAGKPVWATDAKAYERVMHVNFFGVVNGTQAFLPQLTARGEGAVVNISSIFGLAGTPNHADYCASKFAVRGFTEALMVELQHSPVTAHLVHPGGIATNIARQEGTQAFARKYLSTSPAAIAAHIAASVARGQQRIVFGKSSGKTWFGARYLPLTWFNRLIWKDMQAVIDQSDYPAPSSRSPS